jgi:CheY-like chemotaxis protein
MWWSRGASPVFFRSGVATFCRAYLGVGRTMWMQGLGRWVSERVACVEFEYANWVQFWEAYMATRILIADDSAAVRQCLGRLLRSRPGWEVCGEASDGENAVRKAQQLTPDLVILDFMMPGKNGIEIARELGKLLPRIPILLCSVFLTPQLVDLARGAGIAGTLSKGDLNRVIPCVETLLRGGTFFSNHQLDGHEIPDASVISGPLLLPTRINR